MRIGLLVSTLRRGGAERVMSELASHWASAGHEVTLVVIASESQLYQVDPKVRIVELGYKADGKRTLKKTIGLLINYRRAVSEYRPHVMVSFIYKYNILALLLNIGLRIDTYVSDRNYPGESYGVIVDFLKKVTYKILSKGVVAQTEAARMHTAGKLGIRNVAVLPNPVCKLPKPLEDSRGANRRRRIISVGRLVEQKGHRYLIDAFAHINDPDWDLVILGDGELKPLLMRLIEEKGLNNRVYFPGLVENTGDWLNESEIFAFPSLHEGFPNALLEAMTLGMPCVSFDCPTGPRELITDGEDGFLIPVGDIEQLIERLRTLMKDESLRRSFREKARHKMNRLFSRDDILRKWDEFILQI